MKKKNLFRLLWLPALMASVGLTLLVGQIPFGFFQDHNPSHNQAVITYYYIYDPVTGYATAKVTLYQDGCKVTNNMEPAPKGEVSAVVDISEKSGKSVGKWVCYPDKVKYWVSTGKAGETPLMLFTGSQIDDLIASRNKKRASEKFFLL